TAPKSSFQPLLLCDTDVYVFILLIAAIAIFSLMFIEDHGELTYFTGYSRLQ
ncbi:unnamed protein product, partial [Urochloa humidicola]